MAPLLPRASSHGSWVKRIEIQCCFGVCPQPAVDPFPLCVEHLSHHVSQQKQQVQQLQLQQQHHHHQLQLQQQQQQQQQQLQQQRLQQPNFQQLQLQLQQNQQQLGSYHNSLDTFPTAAPLSGFKSMPPILASEEAPRLSFQPRNDSDDAFQTTAGGPASNLAGWATNRESGQKRRRLDPEITDIHVQEDSGVELYDATGDSLPPVRSSLVRSRDAFKNGRTMRETPASSFYGHGPANSVTTKQERVEKIKASASTDRLFRSYHDRPGEYLQNPMASRPMDQRQDCEGSFIWEVHSLAPSSKRAKQPGGARWTGAVENSVCRPLKVDSAKTAAGPARDLEILKARDSESLSANASGGLAPQTQKHLLRLYAEKQSRVEVGHKAAVQPAGHGPGRAKAATGADEQKLSSGHQALRSVSSSSRARVANTQDHGLTPVEERRRWLEAVDAQPVFDALIYSQGGGGSGGTTAQVGPVGNMPTAAAQQKAPARRDVQLFAAVDPRTHWCRPQSERRLEKKQGQAQGKGKQCKARFGAAAQSLAKQRRQEMGGSSARELEDSRPAQRQGQRQGQRQQPSSGIRQRMRNSGRINTTGVELAQAGDKNRAALERVRTQLEAWGGQVWERDKEKTRTEENEGMVVKESAKECGKEGENGGIEEGREREEDTVRRNSAVRRRRGR